MIDIKLEFPPGQQIRLLRILDPKAMETAEAQALNRTRNNVQTLAIKLVAKEMGVTTAKLKKRGRDVQVNLRDSAKKSGKFGALTKGRNATRRRLHTSVRGFGRPFNVGRWDAQEVRLPGVAGGKGRALGVTHRAYGRRQFAKKTWMLENGAVVKRKGRSFQGVFGPGVTQVMEYPHIRRKLERKAIDKWNQHFKSAVQFAFTSRGPMGPRGGRR